MVWKDQWDDFDQDVMCLVECCLCVWQMVVVIGQLYYFVVVCQIFEDVVSVELGWIDLYVLCDGEVVFGIVFCLLVWVVEYLLMYLGMCGMFGIVVIDMLGFEWLVFCIIDGWYGQGYLLVLCIYVVLYDICFILVVSFCDYIDNDSVYDCDEDLIVCGNWLFNIDFSVMVDMQVLQDGYVVLDVCGQGFECIGFIDEYYCLVYDLVKGVYLILDVLLCEYCCEQVLCCRVVFFFDDVIMIMIIIGIYCIVLFVCIVLVVVLLVGCGKEVLVVQEMVKFWLDIIVLIVEMVMVSGDGDVCLLIFLYQCYGVRVCLDGVWKDCWEDIEVVVMWLVECVVCVCYNVMVDDQVYILLVVCQIIEDVVIVELGWVDLFVLCDGECGVVGDSQLWLLLVVDQCLQVNVGSDGVFGMVQVVMLGLQCFVFYFIQCWNGCGGLLVDCSYVVLYSNCLCEVVCYCDYFDNLICYDCDSDLDDCDGMVFNIDFNMMVEQQVFVDGYWLIIVCGCGQDCVGVVYEFYQLMFDLVMWVYQVFEVLQWDDCGGS